MNHSNQENLFQNRSIIIEDTIYRILQNDISPSHVLCGPVRITYEDIYVGAKWGA